MSQTKKVSSSLLETTYCPQFCLLTWMGVVCLQYLLNMKLLIEIIENAYLCVNMLFENPQCAGHWCAFPLSWILWSSEEIWTILVWIAASLRFLLGENLFPHTTPTFAHALVAVTKTCEILCIKADRTHIFKKYHGHLRSGWESLFQICGSLSWGVDVCSLNI